MRADDHAVVDGNGGGGVDFVGEVCCFGCIHGVSTANGDKQCVATNAFVFRQGVGITHNVVGGVGNGDDVAHPIIGFRVEIFIDVVGGNCPDVNTVQI